MKGCPMTDADPREVIPASCPFFGQILTMQQDIKAIKDSLNTLIARFDKQNGRVDGLEGWRDKAFGFIAAIAFISSSSLIVAVLNILGK